MPHDVAKKKENGWNGKSSIVYGGGWWFSCSVVSKSWNHMDYSPPGSSLHGILQVRILEWFAISFSWGSSWPWDQTQVSCITGRFFTTWAMRVKVLVSQSCLTRRDPWTVPLSMEFSRQEYWSGCHFLLQGIFPTQGLNPGFPHCRQTLYCLSHQGSPYCSRV